LLSLLSGDQFGIFFKGGDMLEGAMAQESVKLHVRTETADGRSLWGADDAKFAIKGHSYLVRQFFVPRQSGMKARG
jgi:hypothetical protein